MDQLTIDLNHKIDALSAQVAFLTEQAQIAAGERQRRDELIQDLTPIANQALRLSIEQLEEIQDYIDLGDLLRLGKRLMRNGRNFEKILDQLESLFDLMETIGPISEDAFGRSVDLLAALEQKGYFKVLNDGARTLDKVVCSFSEQELDTSLLGLIRKMGDPGVRRGLAVALRVLQIAGSQPTPAESVA